MAGIDLGNRFRVRPEGGAPWPLRSLWLCGILFALVGCSGNESVTPAMINPVKNCAECGGTGRIEGSCAICKGDGHRTSGVIGKNAVMCSACGGNGTVAIMCHGCGGTGRERIPAEPVTESPDLRKQSANSVAP